MIGWRKVRMYKRLLGMDDKNFQNDQYISTSVTALLVGDGISFTGFSAIWSDFLESGLEEIGGDMYIRRE
jgi:hypothetical protein